jgi:hypothetical protein
MTEDTLLSYCCDVAADGGECLCELERKQLKGLPENWFMVRKTMLPGRWLVAELRGKWVHIFQIDWNEEGEVWNTTGHGLLDMCEGDLEVLQNMLKDKK